MDPLLQQMIDAGLVDDRADVLAQQIRRGQGLMATPGAQGMQVGGTYRAASPFEHLATALSRAMGGRMVKGAEQEYAQGIETKKKGREAFGQAQAGLALPPTAEVLNAPEPPAFSAPNFAAPGLGATADGVNETPARALARAMEERSRLGGVAALSGDPAIAASGQGLLADARTLGQRQFEVEQGRRGYALESKKLEQSAAAQAAEQAHRTAVLGETSRHNAAAEAAARASLDQDAWAAVADPVTGGIVAYNKKTGETRPLGPGGGRPGPGSVAPKPKDLENDVQALGKDVEALTTMGPDLETLRTATTKGDAAGFGPVAGRVPSLLASDEAVANRQAAGRLMAAIIKETSGSAASEGEVQRLLEANGMGRTATPEQLKQGIKGLEGKIATLRKQREAKYHPDVVETYRTRGGHTSAAEPPVPGAVKTKSGRWAVQNAQGQLEYVEGQ